LLPLFYLRLGIIPLSVIACGMDAHICAEIRPPDTLFCDIPLHTARLLLRLILGVLYDAIDVWLMYRSVSEWKNAANTGKIPYKWPKFPEKSAFFVEFQKNMCFGCFSTVDVKII